MCNFACAILLPSAGFSAGLLCSNIDESELEFADWLNWLTSFTVAPFALSENKKGCLSLGPRLLHSLRTDARVSKEDWVVEDSLLTADKDLADSAH